MEEKKEEKKQEEKSQSKTINYIYLVLVFLGGLFIGLALSSSPVQTYLSLPDNTVVLVHTSDNNIVPMTKFALAHHLRVFDLNIDSPRFYLTLGTHRIPLIPPVLSIPAYLCLSQDRNRIIGYYSPDLNVFKLVVSHCYGYEGPAYVYDQNTHQVMEVNG